ncbi:Rhamnogalacturonan exolyase YesX [uncultured Paludibacter sp.]|uniref:Rhamnogalacturonan exolyase YesX n=1 Tax=uncultured Paludibacter sp. TaxID=497635 RepID=A0A653AIV8_9BACT|nr:Rhamnogalacturonan exolyase YesX [uncultured Paludibacter sp.]
MKNITYIILILVFLTVNVFAQKNRNSGPNYDFSKLKMEKLNRGLVAIRENEKTVNVSWRYFSSDTLNTAFDIYRNGVKINKHPIQSSTYFKDTNAPLSKLTYEVRKISKNKKLQEEKFSYTLKNDSCFGYLNIPLDVPANGTTPDGRLFFYRANDASIGDVDGDGEYEIILKWEPSNAHDNSQNGYTGNVYFDCYKLNGKKLWRIDLGKNIRAGAHYTQFVVYDLDGDNKAEMVMKTADGTVDGLGNVIGDANADYRNNVGRILSGPEYLTVFEGLTGKALKTIDYIPPRGNVSDWGDWNANRADRFLACVAYLDGIHPSVVMCRGYYTRTVLAAFDWKNGELTNRWIFDSNVPGNESYAHQGNHNLRVGDVDGDGCDEIIYGACVIDNNGNGLYSTGMGHGDALHLTAFDPSSKKLQVWDCHENRRDGSTFRDAETGELIFQVRSNIDVGRCMAADIDPNNRGVEMWSIASNGIRNIQGDIINPSTRGVSINMACWWDGDLSRELLDGTRITKYNPEKGYAELIFYCDECSKNNGTKSNPCLQADILGDWREEVMLKTNDNKNLRIYVTPYETSYRFHTFLEDPVYRISIATENVAYNQPTQPGFYLGSDLGKIFPEKDIKINDNQVLLDAGEIYDTYQWSVGGNGQKRLITTNDIPEGKRTKIDIKVVFRGGEFRDSVFVTLNSKE